MLYALCSLSLRLNPCWAGKDEGATEPLLNCSYTIGPGAHVSSRESFVSFRVFLLATDDTDLTRQTLSRHRLTQLLAPHVTENPIFFHATDVSPDGFKKAVDQMAQVELSYHVVSLQYSYLPIELPAHHGAAASTAETPR